MIDEVLGHWKKKIIEGFGGDNGSYVRLSSVNPSPEFDGKSAALIVHLHGVAADGRIADAEAVERLLQKAARSVGTRFPGATVKSQGGVIPWANVHQLYPEIGNERKAPLVSLQVRITHPLVKSVTSAHVTAARQHMY